MIAEEYLKTHAVTVGVFLILAAKAPATVWKVHRSGGGVIMNLEKKREYVYHYSFHIMDPAFGHMVIKMSGHPPTILEEVFGAQVILNGHEYVAIAAQGEEIGFTMTTPPPHLAARPYNQHQRTTAAQIGRDHPHWLILWGAHSRRWWAYPRFHTQPGTIIAAATPHDLLTRMRHTELAAQPGRPGEKPP